MTQLRWFNYTGGLFLPTFILRAVIAQPRRRCKSQSEVWCEYFSLDVFSPCGLTLLKFIFSLQDTCDLFLSLPVRSCFSHGLPSPSALPFKDVYCLVNPKHIAWTAEFAKLLKLNLFFFCGFKSCSQILRLIVHCYALLNIKQTPLFTFALSW